MERKTKRDIGKEEEDEKDYMEKARDYANFGGGLRGFWGSIMADERGVKKGLRTIMETLILDLKQGV